MVKVHNAPYIHCRDVRELIGAHWSDCEFAQMAENDSYRSIFCDDDSLKILKEVMKDKMKGDFCYDYNGLYLLYYKYC